MTKLKLLAIAAAASMALALGLTAMPPGGPSVNLSGYEFLLGTSCTIGTLSGKCGVSFVGWTGGSGAKPNGWTPLPGNHNGLWEATVNYTGSPDFNASVNVVSGTFDVLFKNRTKISGTVTGGTVEWPADQNTDIGCGDGVATVNLSLSTGGGPTNFQGCLHDLPAGTVIPPKIWGKLY